MKPLHLLPTVFVACLGLWGCDADKATATMDDTNQSATARIFLPDNTPAAKALVQVWKSDDTLRSPTTETETDADGSFQLEAIPDGLYRIVARKDGMVAMQDSLRTIAGRLSPRNDTLAKPASATGIVRMTGSDNPATVTVLVMGTDSLFNVDKSGSFHMEGLATGTYRLRLSTTLPDYTTTMAVVRIASGKATDLGVIRMNFTGIPPVDSLKALVDSVKNQVLLTWKLPEVREFRFARVYREPLDGSEKAELVGYSYDTAFLSSIFDSYGKSKDWLYTVRIHTMDGDSGYPAWVTVKPRVTGAYALNVRLNGENDSVVAGSTHQYWISVTASPGRPRSLVWSYDGSSHTIPVDSIDGNGTYYNYRDSFQVSIPVGTTTGTHMLKATLVGGDGMSASDSMIIRTYVPKDTTASSDTAARMQVNFHSVEYLAEGVPGSKAEVAIYVMSAPSRPRFLVWSGEQGASALFDTISLDSMRPAPSGSGWASYIDSFHVQCTLSKVNGSHRMVAKVIDADGKEEVDYLLYQIVAQDSVAEDSTTDSSKVSANMPASAHTLSAGSDQRAMDIAAPSEFDIPSVLRPEENA